METLKEGSRKIKKPSLNGIKRENFLIGATLSLSNAFDLFNDAMILYHYERLSRSYGLFQLSMEEAGKSILLLSGFFNIRIYENNPYIRETTNIDDIYNGIEKIFYYHAPKMKYIMEHELWSINQYLNAFNIDTNSNAGIVFTRNELMKDLKSVERLDEMKNESLYTSIKSEKFVQPKETFDIDIVNTIRHKSFSKVMRAKSTIIERLKMETELPSEIKLKELEALKLVS